MVIVRLLAEMTGQIEIKGVDPWKHNLPLPASMCHLVDICAPTRLPASASAGRDGSSSEVSVSWSRRSKQRIEYAFFLFDPIKQTRRDFQGSFIYAICAAAVEVSVLMEVIRSSTQPQ